MCFFNTFAFATEEVTDELPGYAVYAVENLEASLEDDLGTLAQTYVDNYDSAVTNDPDVETNYKQAVEQIREDVTPVYATIWSILPPVIAIVLALITKEVYSSLFVGILSGGLMYAMFNLEGTFMHVLNNGFVASLADSYNVGILIFLVLLGTLVAMMNKAGGSAAFGRWAKTHIKTRLGAQLATIALGCLIFVDDYFNCLTVGSVMRPVADSKKVSRAKLAYLIDATAAPICIIAPISSWAAAVSGFAPEGQGLQLFISAIPFNFYAILTIIMMIILAVCKFDFGPMRTHEKNAEEKGDLFTTLNEKVEEAEAMADGNARGKVIDLIIPVAVLIICCMIGMIYSGGFFDVANTECYHNIITSFSSCDASVGLALGSLVAIILNVIYFVAIRLRVVKFTECMGCLPEGFKAMVPAILILTFAWTLKGMTDSLGAKVFIAELVRSSAGALINFLPAIIFLIAVGLSFSTGTSWGTFGILIPIVIAALGDITNPTTVVAISACMAGAVCGDHCSPISDTTIMASAGAQCDHVNHVSTQLPYALTVAAVSFVSYIIAGFVPNALIVLPIAIILMIATLFAIKGLTSKKAD
ncbi:MAG: Na+/H+ antiporter NhaC family protein [Ruminococcaceae bacterium]|nr:Na+/H+ antiporter NhaC family protein [Oscillospiraceae bacterium]